MELLTKQEQAPLILIVDDIPKNLQVLSSILNTEGYQIAFASGGNQALSVVENTLPDLILLDIMMPDMDGFEVCERLKSNPATASIPVIFLSGKVETEDIVKGFRLGAVDYVTKPFNAIELLSRVKNHLDLKFSKDAIINYNKQLTEYQQELEQVIASKDKFFSIIAHDLRGPFSGFIGLSELLVDEYKNLAPEDISSIAESMHKAAKKLFEFLENLLEWSRSQMGKIEFRPSKLDLFDAIDRAFAVLSFTADNKQISLINNIEKNVFVDADNNMLNTILRNLISNGIKFTKPGGFVKIYTETNSNDYITIKVEDNGIGMTDEAKEKVFRIDSKYSTPGTNSESGTGLGLVLCRELVEKHNGKISVESEKSQGTIFSFTLPLINS